MATTGAVATPGASTLSNQSDGVGYSKLKQRAAWRKREEENERREIGSDPRCLR